jgi:cold-inducible RNA-binding protein
MNIYVGNLAKTAKKTALNRLFAEQGKVVSVHIVRDKKSGNSRGFAYVEMDSHEEGEKAILALNDAEFLGQKLEVNEAPEREEKQEADGKGRSRNYQQQPNLFQNRSGSINHASTGKRGGQRGA